MKKKPRPSRRFRNRSALVAGASVLLLLFLLINIGMLVAYRNRVLPHYMLGRKSIGSMSYAQLLSIQDAGVLPNQMTLVQGAVRVSATPTALGVNVLAAKSVAKLRSTHNWVPIISLFMHRQAPLVVTIDSSQFSHELSKIAGPFTVPPQSDHLELQNQQFIIQRGSNGRGIAMQKLSAVLINALQQGQNTVTVPSTVLYASSDDTSLHTQAQQLNTSLGVQLGFTYGGKTIRPSKTDIAKWYMLEGQTMQISRDKVVAYVDQIASQLGTTNANPADMAVATTYALQKGLSRTFAITPASATQVRTYCTAALGESNSYLEDLIGKLAVTYNDVRGWNDGGRIAFEHVASGCQYTVWISAASQMTSFGSICDDYYNCQVGTNVILNYDRWTTATDPWNKTGGSLEDYRTLMVDHETGHRLGFYDNPTCPDQGQPAPVMMQQSIDLKGCTFNVWPLETEFTQLDTMLGLPASGVSASE